MVFSLVAIITLIRSSSTRSVFGEKSGKSYGIKKTVLKAIAESYILGFEIEWRITPHTELK